MSRSVSVGSFNDERVGSVGGGARRRLIVYRYVLFDLQAAELYFVVSEFGGRDIRGIVRGDFNLYTVRSDQAHAFGIG